MYVILRGKVKVVQTTEHDKEVILAMHASGDFFGEMSLIDSKTIPALVKAMEDSIVAIISKVQFFSLLFAQDKVVEMLSILLGPDFLKRDVAAL